MRPPSRLWFFEHLLVASGFLQFREGSFRAFPVIDAEAALRSFWVWLLIVPGLMALTLAQAPAGPGAAGADLLGILARFFVAWFGYLLVVHAMLDRLGQARLFAGFVLAYNCFSAVAVLFLAVIVTLGTSVLGGTDLGRLLVLGGYGLVLAAQGFMTREALGWSWVPALAMVVLDLMLSILIEALAAAMLSPGAAPTA